MNEIVLYIRVFSEKEWHSISIDSFYLIDPFLRSLVKCWLPFDTKREHYFYSMERNGVLNGQKSLKENGVVYGDSLVII